MVVCEEYKGFENLFLAMEKKNPSAFEKHKPLLKLDFDTVDERHKNKNGKLFKEYPYHDIKHSEQILIRINSFLGNEFKGLSYAEMYFLYYVVLLHDVAMTMTSEDLAEYVKDPGKSEELKEFSSYQKENNSMLIEKMITSPSVIDKLLEDNSFIECLEEFLRSSHPKDAGWMHDNGRIKMAGFRNTINSTMIENIFIACKSHGIDASDIYKHFKSNICECSYDFVGDKYRPMLVSWLLCLGDLLDVGDSRFFGIGEERFPAMTDADAESRIHKKINESLVLSVKKGSVEMKFQVEDTVDGARIAQGAFKWVDYLRKLLAFGIGCWKLIAPSVKERVDMVIQPPNEKFEEGLSVKFYDREIKEKGLLNFTIDYKRGYEIVSGQGIYSTRAAFLREIVQNAMDACKVLYAYDQNKNTTSGSKISNPFKTYHDFALDNMIIKINFIEKGEDKLIITVTDNGIGIGEEEIRYISCVGGKRRAYNYSRYQSSILSVPAWARPTAKFGIGLQSIFHASDEAFTIETAKAHGEPLLKITFEHIAKGGYIYSNKTHNRLKFRGTAISVIVDQNLFSHESEEKHTPQSITQHLCQYIRDVFIASPFKISFSSKWFIKDETICGNSILSVTKENKYTEHGVHKVYFDSKEQLFYAISNTEPNVYRYVFRFQFAYELPKKSEYNCNISYKGVRLKPEGLRYWFNLKIYVEILAEPEDLDGEFGLYLSRETLSTREWEKVDEAIDGAVRDMVSYFKNNPDKCELIEANQKIVENLSLRYKVGNKKVLFCDPNTTSKTDELIYEQYTIQKMEMDNMRVKLYLERYSDDNFTCMEIDRDDTFSLIPLIVETILPSCDRDDRIVVPSWIPELSVKRVPRSYRHVDFLNYRSPKLIIPLTLSELIFYGDKVISERTSCDAAKDWLHQKNNIYIEILSNRQYTGCVGDIEKKLIELVKEMLDYYREMKRRTQNG